MKKQLVIVGFAMVAGLFSCKKDEIKIPANSLKTTYTIDFEDVAIPFKGYLDSINGGLVRQGFKFENEFIHDTTSHSWYWNKGFAVSNVINDTTAGYLNTYATFAGKGADASKNYLISDNINGNSGVKLPSNIQLVSLAITNSTYAALSMKNGDGIGRKFTGKNKDFLKVWIRGYTSGKAKDSVEVYLANFQYADSSQNFIQKDWRTVNLSSFVSVDSLSFRMQSSDNGKWGMNTPGYFTVDNIKYTK